MQHIEEEPINEALSMVVDRGREDSVMDPLTSDRTTGVKMVISTFPSLVLTERVRDPDSVARFGREFEGVRHALQTDPLGPVWKTMLDKTAPRDDAEGLGELDGLTAPLTRAVIADHREGKEGEDCLVFSHTLTKRQRDTAVRLLAESQLVSEEGGMHPHVPGVLKRALALVYSDAKKLPDSENGSSEFSPPTRDLFGTVELNDEMRHALHDAIGQLRVSLQDRAYLLLEQLKRLEEGDTTVGLSDLLLSTHSMMRRLRRERPEEDLCSHPEWKALEAFAATIEDLLKEPHLTVNRDVLRRADHSSSSIPGSDDAGLRLEDIKGEIYEIGRPASRWVYHTNRGWQIEVPPEVTQTGTLTLLTNAAKTVERAIGADQLLRGETALSPDAAYSSLKDIGRCCGLEIEDNPFSDREERVHPQEVIHTLGQEVLSKEWIHKTADTKHPLWVALTSRLIGGMLARLDQVSPEERSRIRGALTGNWSTVTKRDPREFVDIGHWIEAFGDKRGIDANLDSVAGRAIRHVDQEQLLNDLSPALKGVSDRSARALVSWMLEALGELERGGYAPYEGEPSAVGKRIKTTPCIVGEPGSGKTSLVKTLLRLGIERMGLRDNPVFVVESNFSEYVKEGIKGRRLLEEAESAIKGIMAARRCSPEQAAKIFADSGLLVIVGDEFGQVAIPTGHMGEDHHADLRQQLLLFMDPDPGDKTQSVTIDLPDREQAHVEVPLRNIRVVCMAAFSDPGYKKKAARRALLKEERVGGIRDAESACEAGMDSALAARLKFVAMENPSQNDLQNILSEFGENSRNPLLDMAAACREELRNRNMRVEGIHIDTPVPKRLAELLSPHLPGKNYRVFNPLREATKGWINSCLNGAEISGHTGTLTLTVKDIEQIMGRFYRSD